MRILLPITTHFILVSRRRRTKSPKVRTPLWTPHSCPAGKTDNGQLFSNPDSWQNWDGQNPDKQVLDRKYGKRDKDKTPTDRRRRCCPPTSAWLPLGDDRPWMAWFFRRCHLKIYEISGFLSTSILTFHTLSVCQLNWLGFDSEVSLDYKWSPSLFKCFEFFISSSRIQTTLIQSQGTKNCLGDVILRIFWVIVDFQVGSHADPFPFGSNLLIY